MALEKPEVVPQQNCNLPFRPSHPQVLAALISLPALDGIRQTSYVLEISQSFLTLHADGL